jgi:hypothetical protein
MTRTKETTMTTATKPLLCRLKIHFWYEAKTDEGSRYLRCTRCGKDDYRGDASPGEGPNWPGASW